MNKTDFDWYKLVGKPIEFKELCSLINLDLEKTDTKSFKENDIVITYYNFFDSGISLEYHNEIFWTAFLYGKFDKKFKKYEGPLPFYLNMDLDNSQIVGFFGEPNKKNGGHTVPINIQYEQLGLDFTFISPSWGLTPNYISFIGIYSKDTNEDNIICNLCRKKTELKCGQCQLVRYCSTNCQKIHWKVHKSYCQKYFTTKN